MTSSIIDFLEARLAEDEATAKAAGGKEWQQHDALREHGRIEEVGGDVVTYDEGAPTEGQAAHIVMHSPARVLREVQAKRRVMARHKPGTYDYPKNSCGGCGSHQEWDQILPDVQDVNDCPELRDLAAIYSDHPDYRKEWAA